MAKKPGDSSNTSSTKGLGPNPRMARSEAEASPLFPCGGRVYVQAIWKEVEIVESTIALLWQEAPMSYPQHRAWHTASY